MNKHIDKITIIRYLSNKLTVESETMVQEHLSECSQCKGELDRARRLISMYEDSDSTSSQSVVWYRRVMRSSIFRIAAAVILIVGITFAIYKSRPEPLQINPGYDSGEILSVDSLYRDSVVIDTLTR